MSRRHGTNASYNTGCRCIDCTEAIRLYVAGVRARRQDQPIPDHVHGVNGYANYYCRCEVCREGQRVAVAEQRRRRRERAS